MSHSGIMEVRAAKTPQRRKQKLNPLHTIPYQKASTLTGGSYVVRPKQFKESPILEARKNQSEEPKIDKLMLPWFSSSILSKHFSEAVAGQIFSEMNLELFHRHDETENIYDIFTNLPVEKYMFSNLDWNLSSQLTSGTDVQALDPYTSENNFKSYSQISTASNGLELDISDVPLYTQESPPNSFMSRKCDHFETKKMGLTGFVFS